MRNRYLILSALFAFGFGGCLTRLPQFGKGRKIISEVKG
jgi:hypothetical protein